MTPCEFCPDLSCYVLCEYQYVARDHFNAAVLGSKLYVAGGRDSADKIPDFFNNVETAVDVYDFETGQWSTIEDFPRPRGGTMATTFNNDLYVLGGEGQGRAWVEVDVLRSNAFQPAADMPQPRHGSGVVACNGAMWVAGGADVQGGSSSATDTLAFFDGPTPPACSDTLPTTLPPTTTLAALTTPASDVSTSSPVTTAPSTNMPVSPPESSMPSKSPTASPPQETPTESPSTNSGMSFFLLSSELATHFCKDHRRSYTSSLLTIREIISVQIRCVQEMTPTIQPAFHHMPR